MPKLTIDGHEVDVAEGANLIEAKKKADGGSVPHFCYHRKLSIAGNCRMCLVEVEKMPKLQIACNTVAREGMVVHTQNDRVKKARQTVMEFILINHPLDCPVCDQAGECKLQKYYMKYDDEPSRMDEPKVQKDKRVPLGPRVMLDMERCILCSRCVRFCDEVAKTGELAFANRGDHTILTTYKKEGMQNKYSVNTVDICPVGALTSRDFRFKQRVWFLKETPSVCTGCATGCNVRLSHNEGVIYRLRPRENEAVNSVWMCDAGRDTYKEVHAGDRMREAMVSHERQWRGMRVTEALERLVEVLRARPEATRVGIGSARHTNEDNYALMTFLKQAFGVKDFLYHKREVADPDQDDFLIDADKNPNTRGVSDLGMKSLSGDRKYSVLFVLGDLPRKQLPRLCFEKDHLIVQFGTHLEPAPRENHFFFPVSLPYEQEGTVTNRQGRVQRLRPAVPPAGETQDLWRLLGAFGRLLGRNEPAYESVAAIFAEMTNNIPAYQKLTYDGLGPLGALSQP